MESLIRVSQLSKSYGNHQVLKQVSFEVKKGEIFALLGANGAGKTTTLACIEGLKKYDGGEIVIKGKLGVQLQSSSLQEDIKGEEALKLFAKWNKEKIEQEFIERIQLAPVLKKRYKAMSTGQKRKLHLALAMIGNPDIIILDEPTAGLDIESRVMLHEEIRRLKAQGKTIIMASHDMSEVETLCDKVAILKDGEIIFEGTPLQMRQQNQSAYRIKVEVEKALPTDILMHCYYIDTEEQYQVFETTEIDEGLLELLLLAKQEQVKVKDMSIEHTSLEESFMSLTKGESA